MENILEIIVNLIGTLAGIFVVWLAKYGMDLLKAKLNESEKALAESFVESFVAAAEQLYGNEDGSVRLSYVQDRLIEAGYELTDALRAMIEAKVFEINLYNGDGLNE